MMSLIAFDDNRDDSKELQPLPFLIVFLLFVATKYDKQSKVNHIKTDATVFLWAK